MFEKGGVDGWSPTGVRRPVIFNENSCPKILSDAPAFVYFNAGVRKGIAPLDIETVLFAGCGKGFTNLSLESLKHERVFGIDIDIEAVQPASQRIPVVGLVVGDINFPPFRDGGVDLVVFLQVLEHAKNPKGVMGRILRLSSRRYVLVSVPHEPFFRLGNLLFLRSLKRLGNAEVHLNHWGIRGFRQLLTGSRRLVWLRFSFPWILGLIDVSAPQGDNQT